MVHGLWQGYWVERLSSQQYRASPANPDIQNVQTFGLNTVWLFYEFYMFMPLCQMTEIMLLNISLCPQAFAFLQLLIYTGCSRQELSDNINIDHLVTATLTPDDHVFPCSLCYLSLHWRQINNLPPIIRPGKLGT